MPEPAESERMGRLVPEEPDPISLRSPRLARCLPSRRRKDSASLESPPQTNSSAADDTLWHRAGEIPNGTIRIFGIGGQMLSVIFRQPMCLGAVSGALSREHVPDFTEPSEVTTS